MNFWNNPANNAIKAFIGIAIVAIAGYFIYVGMHANSLQSTGSVGSLSVTSSTSFAGAGSTTTTTAATSTVAGGTGTATGSGTGTGTSPGTAGGTTGTTASTRCISAAGTAMTYAPDPTFTPTGVHAGDANDAIGRFNFNNPTPCPMRVTAIRFELNSLTAGDVRNIHVIGAGSPFGSTIAAPTGIAHTMAFATSGLIAMSGMVVPAYATVQVEVRSGITTTAAVGDSFSVQLYQVNGTNITMGTPFSWIWAGGMPAVIAALVKVI